MQEPPLASTITEANPLISESPGALFFIGFDATNNLSTSDMTHVACNRLSSDPHAMMDGSHHMLKPQLMGTRTRVNVLSLGEVVYPDNPKYWCSTSSKSRYPYPIGYKATRRLYDTDLLMSVTEGPTFHVESEHEHYSGPTPSKPFLDFVRQHKNDDTKIRISGPEYFGFNDEIIQEAIRNLAPTARPPFMPFAEELSDSEQQPKRRRRAEPELPLPQSGYGLRERKEVQYADPSQLAPMVPLPKIEGLMDSSELPMLPFIEPMLHLQPNESVEAVAATLPQIPAPPASEGGMQPPVPPQVPLAPIVD